MIEAISRYEIEGVETTLPFGKFVFEHEAFRSGKFDTHFVKNYYSEEKMKDRLTAEAAIASKVALKQYLKDIQKLRLPNNN